MSNMGGLDKSSDTASVGGNQVGNRPLGLKMGYESMWSLLDDVSTDELMTERERLGELSRGLKGKANEISRKLDTISRKSSVLVEVIGNRKWKQTSDNFKLTDQHKTLVKLLYFGRLDTTPQLGYSYSELAKKLGWQLPNEDVSDEQREALEHLIYELPLALEAVIALTDLQPSDVPSQDKGHSEAQS